MRKQMMKSTIGLFVVILSILLILQFIRLERFQLWLPHQASNTEESETMTAGGEGTAGEEMNVYVHKNDSDLSENTLNNFEYALDYAKVPYTEISQEEISNIEPSPYNVLVLAGEHAEEWPFEEIESFVEEGGRLYIGARFIDTRYNEMLGIDDVNDFKGGLTGLTFEQELFPGYTDLEPDSLLLSHSIANMTLREEAEPYLSVEGDPLMWTNEYGDGKALFWNTTAMAGKNTRGLLLQSLSILPPAFASAQADIKTVHIDDFPAPAPAEENEQIAEQYDTSVEDFYTDVWWEDMKQIGMDHDFTYTGLMIGTYEGTMDATAEELIERDRYPMLFFGRNMYRHDGEIGLHGYNHQPLVTEDEPMDPELLYTPWESIETMEESLTRVEKIFHHYYPEEDFKTYVPPSNVLNRTGIQALHETLPSINTIASLYTGEGEGSFIQEFEEDETYPSIYHFPRVSSGYGESAENQFIQADAIANFGVFSHFVHPDDVLDPDRAYGDGWEDMKVQLEDMASFVETTYPYLDSMTQAQATERMKSYQASNVDVMYQEDRIVIQGEDLLEPSTMMLRVEKGTSIETGNFDFGSIEAYGDSGTLYRLTLEEPQAEIPLKDDAS